MSTISISQAVDGNHMVLAVPDPYTIGWTPTGELPHRAIGVMPIVFKGDDISRKIRVRDVFWQGSPHTVVDGLAQHHQFHDVEHTKFVLEGQDALFVGEGCQLRMEKAFPPKGVVNYYDSWECSDPRYGKVVSTNVHNFNLGAWNSHYVSAGKLYLANITLVGCVHFTYTFTDQGWRQFWNVSVRTACWPVMQSNNQLQTCMQITSKSGKTLRLDDWRHIAQQSYFSSLSEAQQWGSTQYNNWLSEARKTASQFPEEEITYYRTAVWLTEGNYAFHGSFNEEVFKRKVQNAVTQVIDLETSTLDYIPWQDIAGKAISNVSDQAFSGNGIAYVKDALTMKSFIEGMYGITEQIFQGTESLDAGLRAKYGVSRKKRRKLGRVYNRIVENKIQSAKNQMAKGVANDYLSNHYGTRLTIADTKELCDSFLSTNFNGLYGLTRAQSQHTSEYTSDDLKITRTARYCCYYKPKMIGTMYEFLHSYDIEPSLGNLWDMVPYSFIIDWFASVGSLLETIDNDYRLKTDYDVVLREQSVKKVYETSNWEIGFLNCRMYVSSYKRWYSNSAIDADWTSVVSLSTPSSHWLEGAALSVQHI